jgi:threonine synthase
VEVVYEYGAVPALLFEQPPLPGLSRWAPLLPPVDPRLSLGEGGTALVDAPSIAADLGVDRVCLKNESANPTWSHKDRFNFVVVSAAVREGAPGVVLATSGNHGISAAAYAARAGLKCVVLIRDTTPAAVKAAMLAHGATVVVVPWAKRLSLMGELRDKLGYHPISNCDPQVVVGHSFGPEGYKTIAYELFLQLDRRPPSVVYVPTGIGELLFGVAKGFAELKQLGLTATVPRLVACEPAARAPLTQAVATGTLSARVADAPTDAHSIGVLMNSARGAIALRQTNGWTAPVTDDALRRARQRMARAGVWAELSAAAAVAGLEHDLARDRRADGTVVCLVTSSGFKDGAGDLAVPRAQDWESLSAALQARGHVLP